MLLSFCAWYSFILQLIVFGCGIPLMIFVNNTDKKIKIFITLLVQTPLAYFVCAHLPV